MIPPIAPGVIVRFDMPAHEYHADPCPTPSLSSTTARAMVLEGCARNALAMDVESTAAMDAGTILHGLILGSESTIDVHDFDSFRTNEAKAARDASIAAGRVPVVASKMAPYEDIADRIAENLEQDSNLALWHDPENGAFSEVTILHQRPTQRGPIWIRTRIDHMKFSQYAIHAFDLKIRGKRGAAHYERMAYDIAREGYDIQAHGYDEAITAAWPEYAGRVRWWWVYAESAPPCNVHVAGRGGVFKARGQRKWDEACEMWARGVYDNEWPGYHQYEQLPEPAWLEAREREYE